MREFKKVLFVTCTMTMMFFLFAISSSASSLSSEETLEVALKQLVEGNIDGYISYIVDENYKDSESMKEDYYEMFSENPVVDFKILHSDIKNIITAEITFKSGEVTETQLLMEKVSDQWKLIIRDLTPEENKTIVEEPKQEKNNGDYSTQDMTLCNYNFYNRLDGSLFLSDCKFTSPTQGLILAISSQVVSQGPPSVSNPSISYQVVRKSLFGTTTYNNPVVVNGSAVYNKRVSLTIDKDGVGKSDLQIRFKTNSNSLNVKWDGRGSIEY